MVCVLHIHTVFFEVGTDIIYTLSCVYDFKQEMLATTVKDGLLAVSLIIVTRVAVFFQGVLMYTVVTIRIQPMNW